MAALCGIACIGDAISPADNGLGRNGVSEADAWRYVLPPHLDGRRAVTAIGSVAIVFESTGGACERIRLSGVEVSRTIADFLEGCPEVPTDTEIDGQVLERLVVVLKVGCVGLITSSGLR